MYEQLLDGASIDDVANLRSNLATVCGELGDDKAAEEHYRVAYEMAPLEPKLRLGFTRFLAKKGRRDLAALVIDGKPLPKRGR